MLNVKYLRTYRSKNGNSTFVYEVSGKEADLEKYKQIQGDFHRTDEETGKPLFFTTKHMGANGQLIITSNNKIVADMSKYEQAASLASQFGGNFGQELARASAQALLGTKIPDADEAPES